MLRSLRSLLVTSSILMSLVVMPWAQEDTGSVVGVLRDSSGAMVAGAKVTTTDADRGTTLTTAVLGTFGDAGCNIIRGAGFQNWDVSIFKTFPVSERYRFEFRAEFCNIRGDLCRRRGIHDWFS
jgi:hypothetical protein